MQKSPTTGFEALQKLCAELGLQPSLLEQISLPEQSPGLPSSFNIGAAAQASIGAAALSAAAIYKLRSGHTQSVEVNRHEAEAECTGYFKLDGSFPNAWEEFSGLYATRDGHVRIHANFDHHRDGVLQLLQLPPAHLTSREQLSEALAQWSAVDFEDAAAEKGLVATMVRTFAAWDQHPQQLASMSEPLIKITRIGDAAAREISSLQPQQRPLHEIRVLDLTRILAGPICGRTLAAYGADVMLINSPNLPNIAAIVDTSRGKRSAHIDLHQQAGRTALTELIKNSHIFVQGYRPGALQSLGFAPEQLAVMRPGIICVSLSAYGNSGPWAQRRGFDSLVQTATGFNHAEAAAAGADQPKALPVPILDYASGFLMAFAAQVALSRQFESGGSWHVEVSLLQTANWLRSLGRIEDGFDTPALNIGDRLRPMACTRGELLGIPHAARFATTPAHWQRPSVAPGTHAPLW